MMNYLFSWAENAEGRMVHVDDVPNGLRCNCICPHCHEQLLARHGDVNEHGFAHHSKTRKATLKICYMVILYKLAEQILLTKKRIFVPSYYGIFPKRDLEFADVKIDNRYEREDKQPDVVATTSEGNQYLIEFVFNYKVQHKKAIDYKNMTCLEVDLSKQSLESLEKFLLSSTDDRKWLNNDNYFGRIEETYRSHGKEVRVVDALACSQCKIRHRCCAVMKDNRPLSIDNNGRTYRLCKKLKYERALAEYEREQQRQKELEEQRIRMAQMFEQSKKERAAEREVEARVAAAAKNGEDDSPQIPVTRQRTITKAKEPEISNGPKSCLDCKANLKWMNKNDGWAHCGCYRSMGLPRQKVDPRHANKCSFFSKG